MRAKFWGVRGSCATPGIRTARYGGNTPCVEVIHADARLVLDAGTGIRPLGLALEEEAKGRPLEIDLLLSHCHWDHIQGFPFFLPAFLAKNTVRIHGLPPSEKPLEKVLRGQMDPEYFPVAMGELTARIEICALAERYFQVGPFRVAYQHLNHPGIVLGYRIEIDGRSLVYATDTEPYRRALSGVGGGVGGAAYGSVRDEELVRFARGADLYIADAQYSAAEYAKKKTWGHTSFEDAVELGLAAGAKRLALFSHDPMHDDDAVDAILDAARAIVSGRGGALEVFAAREGEEVSV